MTTFLPIVFVLFVILFLARLIVPLYVALSFLNISPDAEVILGFRLVQVYFMGN